MVSEGGVAMGLTIVIIAATIGLMLATIASAIIVASGAVRRVADGPTPVRPAYRCATYSTLYPAGEVGAGMSNAQHLA